MKKIRAYSLVGIALIFAVAGQGNTSDKARLAKLDVYDIEPGPKTRVFIESSSEDENRILSVRQKFIAGGAEKVNLFLPSLIVCEVPAGIDIAEIIDDPGFGFIEETQIDVQDRSTTSPQIKFARDCYELARKIATGRTPHDMPFGVMDKTLTVPRPVLRRYKELFSGQTTNRYESTERNIDQNSEFLLGDVLLQVVFPESDGGAENWTDEELTEAGSGAFAGAIAFQETFHYAPVDYVFRTERRVPTNYEPISHNLETDQVWILDTMRNIGIGEQEDGLLAVHLYNNWQRARYGTDWVFTAFVARSRSRPDHRFDDADYLAYAYLGGPYLVMPFPAGRLDRDYEVSEKEAFSRVFQHEMGHIFWAADEYPGSPPCDYTSGYLNCPNLNSAHISPAGQVMGCPDFVPCMMLGVMDSERPICQYSAGQLGISDNDENSVPDVFDSPPVVHFERSSVETLLVPESTVGMTVVATPVHNQNPEQEEEDRIDYVAPLKDAVVSINEIGAIWLTPLDGRWDGVEENLSVKIQGLRPGLTQLQVKARNVFGRSSDVFVKKIYFIGLRFVRFDIDVEASGINIEWQTTDETFGAQFDLYRVDSDFEPTDTVLLAEDIKQTAGSAELWRTFQYFDGDIEPGDGYGYFVRGHFTLEIGGESRYFETTSKVMPARAMLPIRSDRIVSGLSPNPFSQTTTFSVDVPKSFAKKKGDEANMVATGLPVETPTAVQITVYDVRGRLVKNVFKGHVFSQVKTFDWDGTDESGGTVASGVYFLRVGAGQFSEIKKVIIVR